MVELSVTDSDTGFFKDLFADSLTDFLADFLVVQYSPLGKVGAFRQGF